jgi:hypothetical protein
MVQLMPEIVDEWTVTGIPMGTKHSLKGILVCHDCRCWLIPSDVEAVIKNQHLGILFRVPGLGSTVLEHELTRVTSGQPMVRVEALVDGNVELSDIPPFKSQFVVVERLRLIGPNGLDDIAVSDVGNLSEFEQERINMYSSPEHRDSMMAKFQAERKRW